MRIHFLMLQVLLCITSSSCVQKFDQGASCNSGLIVDKVFFGSRVFVLSQEMPCESHIIKFLGYGKKEHTKYGYRRVYASCSCCNEVQFYFESDDKVGVPVSRIKLLGIKYPPKSCTSTNYRFGFNIHKISKAPKTIRCEVDGGTVYVMDDCELDVHGDLCDLTIIIDEC
jgi:hypothetical protein